MKIRSVPISSLFIISSLLIVNQSFAQEEKNIKLDKVSIVEDRVVSNFSKNNRNIIKITAAELQKMPVKSLNELLAFVAGVDVRQRGPNGVQADISMDGGTFDQTLVLVNGMSVSDAQTGHNMMALPITLLDIAQIEIIRGAAANVYGVNALMGAINIITKVPEDNRVTLKLYGGTSGEKDDKKDELYYNYGILANAQLGSSKIKHNLSLAKETGNGYRHNTAFDMQKVYYQANILNNEQQALQLYAGYSDYDFGANGYYAAPGDSNSHEQVKTLLSGIQYRRAINNNWTIKPKLSYQYKQDDYKYIVDPLVGNNIHNTNIVNASLENIIKLPVGALSINGNYRYEHIKSTNLGTHERNNIGISGAYRIQPIEPLHISIGGYLNYNSAYGWQLFPGLDIGYQLLPGLKAMGNVSTAQRLPTYTDLYYKQAKLIIGNDQLVPETSVSATLGLYYQKRSFTAEASYFNRKVKNFIDWVKENPTDAWQPQNFQQLNNQGVTLKVGYVHTFVTKNILENIGVKVAYNYLNPAIEIPEGKSNNISKYAINSLSNQLIATLNFGFEKGFNAMLTNRYLTRINGHSYSIQDLSIQWTQRDWKLNLDFNNLLNYTYTEIAVAPMPGRWMTLGVQYAIH